MNDTTFKPEGTLSFATVMPLHEKVKRQIKTIKSEMFTIDLSNVKQFDSSGLALLIDLISQLKKQSLKYQFVGLSPDLCSLAKFYEVESLLVDCV